MKIVIASDHRGFDLKQQILQENFNEGIDWIDAGCDSAQRCDYPDYASKVVQTIKNNNAQAGILLCGTGIGMSIAANRYPGIYAALCWNEEIARISKQHNNANVLVLPANFVEVKQALAMIQAWHQATFLGDRHQHRIDQIDTIRL